MDAQKPRRIALIDGNAFYCSCERAFCPAYQERPLVVLSNNDGCAIARTPEAKALGIGMGDPWFRIRSLADTHGLIALSANFDLYGDLSARMMSVIGQFAPHQDIYSIDECFLDLTGMAGTGRALGTAIRNRVLQWVGIPTGVGIGATRTLAKLANRLAKTLPRLAGVCDLSPLDAAALMRAIRHVPVREVWGVGPRLAPRLEALGIRTAADLAQADQRVLRQRFSITLARTAQELQGVSCLDGDLEPAPRQQIMCSRSFGAPVPDKHHLAQALSTFTARAAEKLRRQRSLTRAVLVFIRTSPFRPGPAHSGAVVARVAHLTDCSQTLIGAVLEALDGLYRPGFGYARAGVCLLDLVDASQADAQASLFPAPPPARGARAADRLMAVVDTLNQRFGRHAIRPASALGDDDAPWHMRQGRRTPAYTTDWNQLVDLWK